MDGKKVVKTTGIAAKSNAAKKMAQSIADALESAAKNKTSVDNAIDMVKTTAAALGFSQALRVSVYEFLTNYKSNGKLQNQRNYQRAATLFLEFLGDAKMQPMEQIKASQCEDFFKKQCERVSYGTARHYICMLRAAFNSALRDDIIRKNPFSYIRIRALEIERHRTDRLPFSPEEIKIILTKFPLCWRELVLTSYLTGGKRLGDICQLKWKTIDFKQNVIVFPTGKTGKKISVPIVPALRELLENKKNNSEYVFPEMARRYQSKTSVSTEFTSLLMAHGILTDNDIETPKVGDRRRVSKKSFHSIRHSVVTYLRSSPLFTADITRSIVGHNSDIVERAYFTAPEDIKRQVIDFLEMKID